MNSVTLLFTTLCIFAIAYRFYGIFIGKKVLKHDDGRETPAIKYEKINSRAGAVTTFIILMTIWAGCKI
ncbi:MAG: hypothetical protein LBD03_02795 [Methanobrevibacter sp.]|jgi:hypothetical protein|nr:hypothetical protein [Candidatus Methanovirga procula]